jgi:hypothetical protein
MNNIQKMRKQIKCTNKIIEKISSEVIPIYILAFGNKNPLTRSVKNHIKSLLKKRLEYENRLAYEKK